MRRKRTRTTRRRRRERTERGMNGKVPCWLLKRAAAPARLRLTAHACVQHVGSQAVCASSAAVNAKRRSARSAATAQPQRSHSAETRSSLNM